jgi:hypothetical protein
MGGIPEWFIYGHWKMTVWYGMKKFTYFWFLKEWEEGSDFFSFLISLFFREYFCEIWTSSSSSPSPNGMNFEVCVKWNELSEGGLILGARTAQQLTSSSSSAKFQQLRRPQPTKKQQRVEKPHEKLIQFQPNKIC